MSARATDAHPLRRILVALVLTVGAAAGCGDDDSGARDSGGERLGIVIKGLDNPFFTAMREGALAAADDRKASRTPPAKPRSSRRWSPRNWIATW
jgi:ABC-type sugar transport system substrate-binding protein